MLDVMDIDDPCTTLVLVANTSNRQTLDKSNYISIYNPAASISYVKCGGPNVVAAATDTFIPPGQAISFRKNPNKSYIAGFNPTDAVILNIQYGSGV